MVTPLNEAEKKEFDKLGEMILSRDAKGIHALLEAHPNFREHLTTDEVPINFSDGPGKGLILPNVIGWAIGDHIYDPASGAPGDWWDSRNQAQKGLDIAKDMLKGMPASQLNAAPDGNYTLLESALINAQRNLRGYSEPPKMVVPKAVLEQPVIDLLVKSGGKLLRDYVDHDERGRFLTASKAQMVLDGKQSEDKAATNTDPKVVEMEVEQGLFIQKKPVPKDIVQYGVDNGQVQRLSSFKPLSQLTAIKDLQLYSQSDHDLTPLANVQTLEKLSLRLSQAPDLKRIAGLKNLTDLSLLTTYEVNSKSVAYNLAPLRGMSNLKNLKVDNAADLASLRDIPNLEGFVSYSKVRDLSPFSGLSKLKQLEIPDSFISDLAPLKNLTGLEKLTVQFAPDAPAQGLEYLKNFTHLKELKLYNLDIEHCDKATVALLAEMEASGVNIGRPHIWLKDVEEAEQRIKNGTAVYKKATAGAPEVKAPADPAASASTPAPAAQPLQPPPPVADSITPLIEKLDKEHGPFLGAAFADGVLTLPRDLIDADRFTRRFFSQLTAEQKAQITTITSGHDYYLTPPRIEDLKQLPNLQHWNTQGGLATPEVFAALNAALKEITDHNAAKNKNPATSAPPKEEKSNTTLIGGLLAGAVALVVGVFTKLGMVGSLILAALVGVGSYKAIEYMQEPKKPETPKVPEAGKGTAPAQGQGKSADLDKMTPQEFTPIAQAVKTALGFSPTIEQVKAANTTPDGKLTRDELVGLAARMKEANKTTPGTNYNEADVAKHLQALPNNKEISLNPADYVKR